MIRSAASLKFIPRIIRTRIALKRMLVFLRVTNLEET